MSKNLVPVVDQNYVPHGFHSQLKNIIKSKIYYPVFISGESGLGKNAMVENVCGILGRDMIRYNCSVETDAVSLLGGPTLVNGNVVYNDGPVVTAMKSGAVLLLDEISKVNPNSILCLMGILEGKPWYNPHTSETIHPQDGFNIIATANSLGKGCDSGRYLEQILDSAFLERFPITVIQEEPTEKTEVKILSNHISDDEFVENLVKWRRSISRTFNNDGVDEMISIRRLLHIARAYEIFGDRLTAIELCLNRFDQEVREAFLDLYKKLSAGIDPNEEQDTTQEQETFNPSW
jgi:MoxR-like ATPase